MKPVHVGCSGWVYKDWKGELYPEDLPQRRWFERYAEVFETVEINNTFYRLPTIAAVERWAEETPDDFVFAVKGSRYTTHIKRLISFPKYSERFFERAGATRRRRQARAGAVAARRELQARRRAAGGRAGGAPRAPRAATPSSSATRAGSPNDVYELLREHDAALVIGDDPSARSRTRKLTASWTYVRLHRGSAGRRGKYSSRELDSWRRRIAAWRSRHEVFVYFNNDWEGYAPKNAQELSRSFS